MYGAMAARQNTVSDIKSFWNEGAYAESWGLCVLDNVKFQGQKVFLIGNNKLLSLRKLQGTKDKGEPYGWAFREGDQTKVVKPGPDPLKIKIEGLLYPDRDSKGAIVKQLRTKIEELRKICIDADNLNGAGFYSHQLVMPLYKAFYVKIDEYKISTDTTKWGFASFELNCYVVTKNADMQGWLYADNPTKTEVKKAILNWKDKIKARVNDVMGPFNDFVETAHQFKSTIEQNIAMATGLINDARGWVENVMDLADISGMVNELSSAVQSLIYAPKAIMNSWENIVDSFKSLKNIYTDNAELWKNLYQKNDNSFSDPYANAFNRYNQENSYANVIDEIIGDDDDTDDNNGNLETEEDINNAKDDIDNMFYELVEKYTYTYDELVEFKKLRLMILTYLNSLQINKTEEFVLNQFTPATVASYLRYGDLTHARNITILNDDNLFLKGVVHSA